ncbi:MAG: GumC family protein [Halanaerobiaceae bacterium]
MTKQNTGGPAPEMDEVVYIDLEEFIDVLLEKWYIIVAITLLALGLAGVYSYTQDPIYKSHSRILIEDEAEMAPDSLLSSVDSGADNMGNRLQIIQSPLVLDEAVESLRNDGLQEAADDLEDRGPDILEPVNVEGTDIIELSVTGFSPADVQAKAEAVTLAYQDYREQRAREQSMRVNSFLEEQVEEAEVEVEEAEKALRDYQRREGIISLENEASKVNDQLSELEGRLVAADIAYNESSMRLKEIETTLQELGEDLPGRVTTVTVDLVDNLRAQLAELEAERVDYINRGLETDSPEVVGLDARIESLEESIRSYSQEINEEPQKEGNPLDYYNELLAERTSLEAELSGRENEIEFIEDKISNFEEQLTELSDKGFTMARRERDLEVARETYSLLLEELEKSRISVEREITDVRIVQEPLLPESPVKPRTRLNLIIAGFLGICMGTGLVLLLEYLDDTVKEKDELEQLVGKPVLGVIPDFDSVDHNNGGYYSR